MITECDLLESFIIMAMDWETVTYLPIGIALAVDGNAAFDQAGLRWPENTILQAVPWEEVPVEERLVALENDRRIW